VREKGGGAGGGLLVSQYATEKEAALKAAGDLCCT